MKNSFCLRAVSLCLLIAIHSAQGGERLKIPMTAGRWTTTAGQVEFVEHLGAPAIDLKPGNYAKHIASGQAVLNGLIFRNGTIEYDVDARSGMGAGFVFRKTDEKSYEMFYLRPRPKCEEAPDCIQYAPQSHGVLLWDVFPQYQSPAPLHQGEWNHVKLVISGRRMDIFINGAEKPTLKIGRLEGDTEEGGLMVQGPGIFANLTVDPGAVEGLAREPEKDPTASDSRYVRNWQIAPFSKLAADQVPKIEDLPSPDAAWRAIEAERDGLVNVSRMYGLPFPRPELGLVWLKTSIHAGNSEQKRVSIGWVREIWVFVNGKPVFADKNLYMPPQERKTPDGRCSLENGSFLLPLQAEDNEVAVALANNFYGWGLIMRLDDLNGLRLTGE
ncbi:MAG TPA: hypothetical protein VHZ07_08845 [Bryobacteraceae bacterium]|jgi:hypothetical protein|nr:hypothetical protein [Bryobacteraceae bacterium]